MPEDPAYGNPFDPESGLDPYQLSVQRITEGIELTWNEVPSNNYEGYSIFRRTNNTDFEEYANVYLVDHYLDRNLKYGLVRYLVVARHNGMIADTTNLIPAEIFIGDNSAGIDTFFWLPAQKDSLTIGDSIRFILRMEPDDIGEEIGGEGNVLVNGWDPIPLVELGNGTYTAEGIIDWSVPSVRNRPVRVQFQDRAGNSTPEVTADRQLTVQLPDEGDTWTFRLGDSDLNHEMCWIPAGSFVMGAPTSDPDSDDSERPRHIVNFSEGFWMSRYEITQREWVEIMGSWSFSHSGDPRLPATNIGWNDCRDFIEELNDTESTTFWRLPSEAEWEYAARAESETRFYWGDDPDNVTIESYAWYSGNSDGMTHIVGEKLSNYWSLFDMSGNVAEWCEDDLHTDYTNAPQDGSPWIESPRTLYRIVRGGCFSSDPASCRSAQRSVSNNNAGELDIGVRLVREIPSLD